MPIYDYDCAACGLRVEVVHSIHAPGPTQCPNCGDGPIRKAIAAAAVHFKGSGWAKRDRRAPVTSGAVKGSTDVASATDASAKDGGDTSDGAGSDRDAGGAANGTGETATPVAKTAGTSAATKTD